MAGIDEDGVGEKDGGVVQVLVVRRGRKLRPVQR
jgi:hypothetical protein